MRRIFITLAFLPFLFPLQGEVLLNDSFSYPDGILQEVSDGKWVGHSGETNQVDVSGGAVNLTGKEVQDVNAGLLNAPFSVSSGVTLYAAFKISFSALPTASGSYFAHFKNASTGFRGRIWAVKAADGKFNLGISSVAAADPFALYPSALDLNSEYRVVVKLDIATAQATLWINPASESDTNAQSDAGAGVAITSFALRQSSGMGTMRMDDLVIATTFEEATGQGSQKPVIVQQPANTSALRGTSTHFTVQASGPEPLTYQWLFNDAELFGETNSTLTLFGITEENAGVYAVRVRNNEGSVLSAGATLTVQIPASAPAITQQPSDQTADTGDTVSFQVIANGTEPLGYEWSFNGVVLADETSPTLTLAAVTVTRSGTYQVRVSNSAGFALSDAAILVVREPVIAPSIAQQPLGAAVEIGGSALFSVIASGTEPLEYQWSFNGLDLPGETGSMLALNALTTANSGAYRVRISNSKDSITSDAALLNVFVPVAPPEISQQPEAGSFETGDSVSLIVVVTGSEPLIYEWKKDGQALPEQTSATLTLLNLNTNNAGYYSVSISNEVGNILSDIVLLQVNPPPVIDPPVITFTNYLFHLVRPGDLETNTFTEHALQPGETLRMEVVVTDPAGRAVVLMVNTNELPPEAHWIASSISGTNSAATFEFTPAPESAGRYFPLRLQANNGATASAAEWSFYVPTAQEQNVVLTEFLANPVSSPSSLYFNPLHRALPSVNPSVDDQYVEIANLSAGAIDLAGWSVSDSIQLRHSFNAPFSLESSNAVVIYGGPLDGSEPALETPRIPASESFSELGLFNAFGDTVMIRNPDGHLISRVVYGTLASPSSLSRYPDANGPFLPQELLGTNLFSPGKKWNGESFAQPRPTLEIGNLRLTRTLTGQTLLSWRAQVGEAYTVLRAAAAGELFTPVASALQFSGEQGEYTDVTDASTGFYVVRSP